MHAANYANTKNAAIRQRMKQQEASGKRGKVFMPQRANDDDEKKDDYPGLPIAVTMSNDEEDDNDSDTNDDHLNLDAQEFHPEDYDDFSDLPMQDHSLALMGRYCDDKELEAFQAYEQGTLDLLQTSLISIASPDQTPKTPRRRLATTTTTPHHVLDAWQKENRAPDFFSPPALVFESSKTGIVIEADHDDDSLSRSLTDTAQLDPSASTTTTSPFSTVRLNDFHVSLEESKTYIVTIAQLRKELAAAREENRGSQARVRELESTLQMQTRTPASSKYGTPATAASSLPCSLWARNETLVKEVRFADQTCVELSGQKSVLEKEVSRLQQQLGTVQEERQQMRQDLQESRQATTHAENRCQSLTTRLDETDATAKSAVADQAVRRNERIQMAAHQRKQQQELVDTRQKLTSACSLLQEAKETLTDQETSHSEMIQEMHEQLAQANEEKEALSEQVFTLTENLQETQKRLKEIRDEKEELDAKLQESQLRAQNRNFDGLLEELQAEKAKVRMTAKIQEATVQTSNTLQVKLQEAEKKREAAEAASATLKIQLQEAARNLETAVNETERKLQGAGAAYTCLKKELQQERVKTTERATAVLSIMQHRQHALETQLKCKTDVFATKLGRLSTSVSHIKESLDFGDESSQRDFCEVSSQRSPVETLADQYITAYEGYPGWPDETTLNATFNAGSNRNSANLELMEEARSHDAIDNSDERVSGCAQATDDVRQMVPTVIYHVEHDTMSSIQGISHLFQEEISPSSRATAGVSAEGGEPSLAHSGPYECSLSDSRLHVQTLLAHNDEIEQDRIALRQTIEQLEVSVALLEGDLVSSTTKLDEVSSDRNALTQRLDSLQLEKSNSKEHASNVESNLLHMEKISEECDLLRDELDFFREENEDLQSRLESELKARESADERLHQHIDSSSLALEKATNERDILLEQLDSVRREQMETELELQVKSKALLVSKEICSKLDMLSSPSVLEELQIKNSRLLENLNAKSVALDSANEVNNGLSEQSQELEKAFAEKSQHFDALQVEKIQLELEVQAKVATLGVALKQCDEYRLVAEQQALSVNESETEIGRLRETLYESEGELERIQMAYVECTDKLASYDSVNDDTHALLEVYQKTQQAAEDLALDAGARLLQARNQIEEIRLERDTLYANHDDVAKELHQRTEALKEQQTSMEVRLEEKDHAIQAAIWARDDAVAKSQEFVKQLDKIQGKLHRLDDFELVAQSVESNRDQTQAILVKKEAESEDLRAALHESNARLAAIQKELFAANEGLQEKETETFELRGKREKLESKCNRLREYIRKLTAKCDQWETYYEEQAEVVEQLHCATVRTRQKAHEIALKYKQRDEVRVFPTSNALHIY